MNDPIIKISCKNSKCDGYVFFELQKYFDGKCNICDSSEVDISEPSIEEVLNFAQLELERANHHPLLTLPEELYKNIIKTILLSPSEEKKLAQIIALTFHYNT